MFEDGCLHLIHGKTTILPVDRSTPELQLGLSKGAPSRSGNRPVQVPFYGFMGNVSPQTCTLSKRLMVFPPGSGRGQERFLVCHLFDILSLELMVFVGQFNDYREHQLDDKVWARITCIFLLRF